MYQADQFFYMQAVERKAAAVVYKRFGINRYELNMLASLSAYLCLKDKRIISRKIFTDWLGLGYKEEKRCWVYLQHLVRKGVIHRLAYRRPDGNSLAISEYGIRILDAFYQALSELEQRVPDRSYTGLALDTGNLPDGYTLKQAGRS